MTRFERDRLRMAILEEANIVCTTLSFSGSGLFLRLTRKFDVVVIDEAAQVGALNTWYSGYGQKRRPGC